MTTTDIDYVERNKALDRHYLGLLRRAWAKYRAAWHLSEPVEVDESIAPLFQGRTLEDDRQDAIERGRRRVRHCIVVLRQIRADGYASYQTPDEMYARRESGALRTPDHLAEIGRAIYGNEWQAPLARRIDISRETIRRMLNGSQYLWSGHGLWDDLADVLAEEIEAARARIDEMARLRVQLGWWL